jgi:hypothetical protein
MQQQAPWGCSLTRRENVTYWDKLALLWQIFAADERDGIPKSVFQ